MTKENEKQTAAPAPRTVRRAGKHAKKERRFSLTRKQIAIDGILAVLFGAALGLAVLLNTARYGTVTAELTRDFLTHPIVIALNLLPVVVLTVGFWLLTGRVWAAAIPPMAVFLFGSFTNYFKIYYRSDPVVAADLRILREVGNISERYPIVLTRWMIAEIVIFGLLLAAFVAMSIVRRRRFREGKTGKTVRRSAALTVRAVCLAILIALIALVIFPLYNSESAYYYTDLASDSTYLQRYDPADQYVSHGFVFSFFRSVYRSVERPVDGYSEELAKSILARYTDADIPEDKKIDVIAVMLEAFADFSGYDEIDFTDDVDIYGEWHRICEEGVSGQLVTNIFAARTINSERNFLTGFDTSNDDYYEDSTSFVRYFKDQGYTVTGAHPGENWFYNRRNINERLGFDEYYFRQNRYESFGYEDGIVPDAVFLEDVWRLYEERDKTKPYFNFNVTYQNHAPYSDASAPAIRFVSETQFAGQEGGDGLRNILSNYFNGIYQTNQALGTFVDHARGSDRPIALIFFGDHKPWLGGGNSVYEGLGINLDLGTEEGMLNYFSTSYVIWMNDAAKEVLGEGLSEEEKAARFSGNGGCSSPFFLIGKLFDMAGWEGPAFMQLERDFQREQAIAINREAEFYVLADGTFAKDPGEEVLAREREILYCQYYLKHNNIYAK